MKNIFVTGLWVCLTSSAAWAGTLTASTEAPTGYFASGSVDGPSFTRIFADGANANAGRGNEIIADIGVNAGATITALVLRKDGAGGNPATGTQDFTGATTALLTLHVFEGTKEMWDAGDGQDDGDLWDGTGITTIHTETFALNDSYAEGDYITLTLATPITMAADMGFFIKMTQGNSAHTFFQIVQVNNPLPAVTAADGNQYQSEATNNKYVISPLEYYVVGTPGVAPALPFAITNITYDGGNVTLAVSGAPNTTYNVKASATLADGFPDLVGTVTTDGSGVGSFGPFTGVGSAEFYRLETQP